MTNAIGAIVTYGTVFATQIESDAALGVSSIGDVTTRFLYPGGG
jgi:uncharacterized protein (UPF0218 family)